MRGMNIGDKLKTLRTNYGYKQKDISEFLGVDQSLISKFESGERAISVDMLEKLGNLYCCIYTSSSCFNKDGFGVS